MKFIYITLLSLFSLSVFSQDTAIITKETQTINWKGKAATGGYEPEGTINIIGGEITYSNTEITALYVTIDMRSLYHENKQLKTHLKEEDFFDVKKFPVATFTLKEKAIIENNSLSLHGEMTIKGTSNTEVITAILSFNKNEISLTINHEMDRTRYGVNFNSPSIFTSMKENLIADEFSLKGSVSFKNE